MTEDLIKELIQKLHDPSFGFMDHYFELSDDHIRELWNNYSNNPLVQELVYLYLLRMRHASVHMFTFEVPRYQGLENLSDFWEAEGMKDGHGYEWLMPKPFGPYNMR